METVQCAPNRIQDELLQEKAILPGGLSLVLESTVNDKMRAWMQRFCMLLLQRFLPSSTFERRLIENSKTVSTFA
jgi:hypothetical protein